MNLFPYILGPVWVLDVTLTSDGHTIAAWRCKMGGEPQQTVYDAAAVAKGVAVVTVSGHGTIVKPADSQLAARVRDDRATFLWSEHDGRIAFVRRERLQGMLTELSEAGIHPQRIEVSAPPDTAAGELLAGLGWRQLLRPTAEGSSLAQAVVRRAALPVLGLFLCLLAVFRILPVLPLLALALVWFLLFQKRILKEVDYCLLLTFVFFFILIGNLGRISAIREALQALLYGREVLVSFLSCQLISNVPAAVLLSEFTDRYDLLLAGVNIGGLGTLIASMASLISYKYFAQIPNVGKGKYLLWFTLANLLFAIVLLGLAALLPS